MRSNVSGSLSIDPNIPAISSRSGAMLIALGADVVGLGASVFGQLLRATPFPVELASLVSLVDNEPRLRGFMEQHLGTPVTDLGLGLSNAFVQALSQGPLGLAVDIGHRANLVRESQERRRSWERRELELQPSVRGRCRSERWRPRGVPPLCPRALSSGMPTGPRSPRSAYSAPPWRSPAALDGPPVSWWRACPRPGGWDARPSRPRSGSQLAQRDVVVLDRAALRRLDRVDMVLLDADVLVRRSELDPLAEALVGAARRGGLGVVVAGGGAALAKRLGCDRSLAGGRRLAHSVRSLQLEGHVVLLGFGVRRRSASLRFRCRDHERRGALGGRRLDQRRAGRRPPGDRSGVGCP